MSQPPAPPPLLDECETCDGDGGCRECEGTGHCPICGGSGTDDADPPYCNALYWDGLAWQRCDRRGAHGDGQSWQCTEHLRQQAWLATARRVLDEHAGAERAR